MKKNDILSWLEKYIINSDLTVDVNGDVRLERNQLVNILFKFNKIEGDFYIFANNLISLKNCPNIVKGDLQSITIILKF